MGKLLNDSDLFLLASESTLCSFLIAASKQADISCWLSVKLTCSAQRSFSSDVNDDFSSASRSGVRVCVSAGIDPSSKTPSRGVKGEKDRQLLQTLQ